MKIKNKWALLSLCALMSASCVAYAKDERVHTWHKVIATAGTWQAKLSMLNQGGHFVDRGGHHVSEFIINKDQNAEFGFVFDQGDDFDVSYTLTIIQKTSQAFVSKACVYVITAKGPAQPDVRPLSYNGADCQYRVVAGVGEDYIVGFKQPPIVH